jgi:hypothetical protein
LSCPNALVEHPGFQLAAICIPARSLVGMTESEVLQFACEFSAIGFGSYDALHLAFAEQAAADIFLTTDDRLLKLASKCSSLIKVKVDNPLGWLREAIQNEYRDHDS